METCDHCRRMIGTEGGDGWSSVGELKLCHPKGDNLGRPNCFVLVAKYGHKADCKPCARAGMAVAR